MNIVLFSHPVFLNSTSMPRFAQMIADGMRKRGHTLNIWTPQPIFFRIPVNAKIRKWLGYVDQYVLFPLVVRFRLLTAPVDTVYVFADQALGPWVPLVKHLPHVVHVHDFLALRSSLGEIPQNPTGWTGKQYQAMIRRGFTRGKNFISVSENTKEELSRFLTNTQTRSVVVYNGINFPFSRMAAAQAIAVLQHAGIDAPPCGLLLHVGGNQWYKNRLGVLEIYIAYTQKVSDPLPLLMIGEPPTAAMTALITQFGGNGRVKFASGVGNQVVCAAYSHARLLIFPSLAEGFGWPIAEAMVCGCPVLTTGEAPMTEVGGGAAFHLLKRPFERAEDWAEHGARQVINILNSTPDEVAVRMANGYQHVQKFDAQLALSSYEAIYKQVLPEASV